MIGLGKTGLSCVDFLLAKQADVRVIDTRTQPAGAEQLAKNVPLHTGSLNQQWL
ncbi:UDP-N-acetylmuramoyl-L-alanyl-D-glutamate synthetase, partial [Pasteurella multocida subsp. multocida str. Anand1_cattle]